MEGTRRRRAWLLAGSILAGTAGFALARCSSERPAAPAVVLVTLDTFRSDHLGCAGHPFVRTPHLDRLARGGSHWTEAVSPIPLTTPSHASILTGLSPRSHGLLKNRMRLPEGVPLLAERLLAAGLRTGAVVSSRLVLDPAFGLDRGFETYEVVEPEQLPASGEGAATARAARAWMSASGGAGSFLWVHFFDAHLPYLPPAPLDRLYTDDPDEARRLGADVQSAFHESASADPRDVARLAALYASEITFLDRCVGELVREAEAGAAATTFLVTADHGEGLHEHERYFGHDILLYETSLRVPMILGRVGPGGRGRPDDRRRSNLIREPARTLDVTPTILGLCGAAPLAGTEGRDLRNDPPPAGDELQLVAETHPSREKATPRYALRTEEQKVVWEPRRKRHEFYDLVRDPGERRDLGDEAPPIFRVLAEDLDLDLRLRPVGRPRTVDEERGGPAAEVRDALRSLGYLD